MSGCADAACFVSGTVIPKREKVLPLANNGQAGRDLLAAVFDRDAATAARLLRADPRLADTHGGTYGDLLTVAIGTCDKALVETLIKAGASVDGVGETPPLGLAIRGTEPWFAQTLLKAGASPNPRAGSDYRLLDSAIQLNSKGAVRLLLDHGARLDHEDSLGSRPLQTAVDSHVFAIAELLLDRGADPWAADNSGGTLGWAVARPPLSRTNEDVQAHLRLKARVAKLGWPDPAPAPKEVRALVAAGRWPPPGARR